MTSPASSPRRPPRRRSRLADEHPAWPPTPTTNLETPVPPPEEAAVPDVKSGAQPTMPPPRRRKEIRVQLNTRVRHDLHERLQAFITEHEAAVQDVVEAALSEYLDRRRPN